MNCPICNKHRVGDMFDVYYTAYVDNANNYLYPEQFGLKTWVYDCSINSDEPLLLLDGFVVLDKERIEKLLLLK